LSAIPDERNLVSFPGSNIIQVDIDGKKPNKDSIFMSYNSGGNDNIRKNNV